MRLVSWKGLSLSLSVALVEEGEEDPAVLGVARELLLVAPVLLLSPDQHLTATDQREQESWSPVPPRQTRAKKRKDQRL